MRPVLLIDPCMKPSLAGRLQTNDFAAMGILKVAERKGLEMERFLLLENTGIDGEEIEQIISGRKGVILGGSGRIHLEKVEDMLEWFKWRDTHGKLINDVMLRIVEYCANNGIPVLGICYGHQAIARFAGERVERMGQHEFGFMPVRISRAGEILEGLPPEFLAAEHHSLGVISARYVEVLAESDLCAQAIRVPGMNMYGVQFHPDFHSDIDGTGTGSLEHYYHADGMASVVGRRVLLKPDNTAEAYALNNRVLLNFFQMCATE